MAEIKDVSSSCAAEYRCVSIPLVTCLLEEREREEAYGGFSL